MEKVKLPSLDECFTFDFSSVKSIKIPKSGLTEKEYWDLAYYESSNMGKIDSRDEIISQGYMYQYFKYINFIKDKPLFTSKKKFDKKYGDIMSQLNGSYKEWKDTYKFSKEIDKSLTRMFKAQAPIPYAVTALRVISPYDPILYEPIGSTGIFDHYISTSVRRDWKPKKDGSEVLIKIVIPKGFKNWILWVVDNQDRRELTINKGVYYKVIDDKTLLVSDSREFNIWKN